MSNTILNLKNLVDTVASENVNVIEANESITLAASEANRATAQVGLASDQVVLATEQVSLASDEVQLAKNEVVYAQGKVSDAQEQVVLAEAQVELANQALTGANNARTDTLEIFGTAEDVEDALTAVTDNRILAHGYKDEAKTSSDAAKLDRIQTGLDAEQTGLDRADVNSNALATAESELQSQLRAWESEADRLSVLSLTEEPVDVVTNRFVSNQDGTFTKIQNDPAIYSALHYTTKAEEAFAGGGESAEEAQEHAWIAEAYKMTADSYATEPEDVYVKVYTSNDDGTFNETETDEYSAMHWKEKSIGKKILDTAQSFITQDEVYTYSGLEYVEDSLMVVFMGAILPGEDYTATDGESITFNFNPQEGNEVNLTVFNNFEVADVYNKPMIDDMFDELNTIEEW